MKKLLSVLVFVLSIAVYPSSKILANNQYYSGTISAEVNGVVQTFNVGVTGTHKSTAGMDGMTITGLHDATSFGISIVISRMDGEIKTGSYVSSGDDFQVLMTFSYLKTMQSYQNMPSTDDTYARVRITSITGNTVQGTFSGTLKLASGGGSISISNGTFNINL